MCKKYNILPFIAFILLLISQTIFAQVTPNINSGNPSFPFPQFLDYGTNKKTLASVNAPGVTHAEMEQRIRDAWQMICNDVSPYPSTIVGGVQYLYPTAPNHCTCVEGDGYYLMGAAVMADKTFFDGYYMWAHDRAFHGTQRFVDGVYNTPNYGYAKGLSGAGSLGAGTAVNGGGINGNSATDGDVDVALALLIAYKQWGEHSGIFIPALGNKELNYKEEAIKYIRAMVDTAIFPLALPMIKYTSGDVGFDGYLKGGDSQGELTDWANAGYMGMQKEVGQQNYYYDYSAPAWFREYRMLLEAENDNPFYISQYKRVEASCDWLMGLHYSKNVKNIPYLGKVSYNGGGPTDFSFSNYIPDGEDFRASWRTIMNYVWHDNPTFTWDPVTHQAVDGKPNSYERDMGIRYAKFLKEPQSSPWNNPCRNIGDLKPKILFKGPYTLVNGYTPDGTATGGFPLNWIHGTGAASAVVGQDFELMGEMFRHCIIAWDGNGYLNSKPTYFHEWFKMLGLITLSGNFHAPSQMIAQPNIKVYHKIDKTYAFTGDQITYTVTYRNYGSVDGTGTVVKFGIPSGFSLISTTKGSLVGDSIVWNVGTAKGFKTGGLAATIDSMKIVLKIGPTASGRYCTNARVSCTNGLGWTSNEYPNNITAVMERNCIDVVKRALQISKTSDRLNYNPGQDVKYKIVFENSSDAGWINGGRPGVRIAFAHKVFTTPTADASNELKYRIFHDAAEAYINFGNYRVSYFINDPSIKGMKSATYPSGWDMPNSMLEGGVAANVKVFQENIVPGSDANGTWNQRVVLQFADQLATITQHLQQYTGSPGMVHEGGMASLRGVWFLNTGNWSTVDWTDDWSWDATKGDLDAGIYYPVGDDYTDPNNLGVPVDSWHKSACTTTTNIMKKILVEEWDGYTWRRIYGNGPSPGRDVDSVTVTDTLPAGVSFKNFIKQNAFGISATTITASGKTIIKWTIPKMQVNMKDSLMFTATIDGACPLADKQIVNRAWIQGKTESAIFKPDTINVTCTPITICPEATTFTKTSDKATYTVGQTVKYSMNFTQTVGSIANPSLSSATDWTTQVGSGAATFAGNKLTVGQLNSGDFVITHDYSYGTNTLGDGIQGTIQITNYAKAAIVLRHKGGVLANGAYIVIKPGYPTAIQVFNGTTLLGSYTIPDQNPASLDFQIKLTGSKLELWIGVTPTSFSGAAAITVTGLPIQAGWFGIARGNTFGDASGSAVLTSWSTHLDAAFNVTITDPVPTGIINPTGITTSLGTASNVSNVITYNLVTGKTPMLYNATATLGWNGTYNVCKKITNVAYVNAMGLNNNQYGICYDVNCNNVPTCSAPTSVSLSANPVGTVCFGNTVTLTATAAPTGTWTYAFKKATTLVQTSTTATTYNANTSGSYTVTAYDIADSATCSKVSAPVTVTINPLPKLTVTATPAAICKGETTTLKVSGADTYLWSNNLGTTASVTVAPTSTQMYYVTGTDANGCVNNDSIAVTINPLATVTAIASPASVCLGSSTSLTASGASTYTWSNNLGNTATITATPSLTTTYTVTGTDINGCTGTANVIVTTTTPSLPLASDTTITIGAAVPTLTATGTTIKWYDANKTILLFIGTSYTPNISTATNTTYNFYVTNTENGCESGFVKVSIIVNGCTTKAPTLSSSTVNTCQGLAFPSVTATGSNITWYDNTSTPIATGATFTPPAAGDYYATQTIICEGPKVKLTAAENPLPIVSAIASPATICNGETTTLTATGGNTYLWSNTIASASQTVTPSTTTTYTVTAIDANSCINTSSVKVTVTPLPTVTINPVTIDICPGKSQTLTATGATTYKWSTTETTASIIVTPASSKTYSVTGSTNSCSSTASSTVNIYPLTTTTVSADKNPICVGDKVQLTASGGNTYVWSSGGLLATETLNPAATNSYTVTGTDINGCNSFASITVTVHPLPTITATATNSSVCLGNSTNLTASGALTYNWDNNLGNTATVSITPSTTSTYTVTGTNTNGCVNTATVTVNTLALPTVSLTGGGSYCTTLPAVTVSVSGGKANYNVTYTRNGTNPFVLSNITGTANLPITADGDYEITQVEDANNCIASTYPPKVTVSKNGTATYSISGGAEYCKGQKRNPVSIDITSNDGPWTLVYNDGKSDFTQSIAIGALPFEILNPNEGIYTVKQITNKDNCVAIGDATKSTTVIIHDTTIATITGLPATLCDNGKPINLAFTPTLAAGETATISSTTGGVSGTQFNPSQAGGAGLKTLVITYTNANSCVSQNKATVSILSSPVASIAGTPGFGVCFGTDQVIDASHTNTTAPYTFGWYLSNTLLTADNIEDPTFKAGAAIGIYPLEYIVTDGNGCKDTADINIEVKNKTKPQWLATLPQLCSNGNSIDLKNYVTPYDANGSFSFDGTPSASTIFDPTIMSVTTHGLRYTYAMGSCVDNADTTITINQTPNINLGTYQNEFCDYGNTYTFTGLSPTQGGVLSGTGVSAMTFDPKLATTKDAAFDLTYTVTQNGCTDIKTIPITVWSAPKVTFNLPSTVCAKDAGIDFNSITSPLGGIISMADGISGNYFYPKKVTGYGTPITISYTASSHGCITKVDKTITVNKTNVPTVTDASAIVPVTTVPPVTASGNGLKLYSSSYTVIDGNWNGSYANQANTAPQVYTYWVTQTENGCESDSVPVKLTITNCTAKTPGGVSTSQCYGDTPGVLTATGLSQTGMIYRWFDKDDKFTGNENATLAMNAGLTVGKYTYYVKIYDTVNACYGAASQPIIYEVKALPNITFAPDTVMCENNAIQDLSKKTVPATATFWLGGTQIANFNPMGKVGINKIEVRYTDASTTCKNNIFDTIRVKSLPSLSFSLPQSACTNGSVIQMTATPVGGVYFGGPLQSDGKSILPKNLTINTKTTYNYTYTDAQGCSDTVSADIIIYDSTKVKIQLPGGKTNLCEKGSAINLGADITGGTFTINGTPNAGIFTPTIPSTYKVVYTYTNANGCTPTDQTTLTVNALPAISNTIAASDKNVCSNGSLVSLTGTPSGLIFNGASVNTTITGYTFNPKTASIGANKIYYSFTNTTTGCSNKDSLTITVKDIKPPVVQDQSFFSFNYPKTIVATGTDLKWYGNKGDKSDFIQSSQQLTNVDLKTKNYTDSLNKAGLYTFFVTQTIDNCESDVAKTIITINNCSTQPPVLNTMSPASCYGMPYTTITVNSHTKGDETHWYNANKKYLGKGDSFTPQASDLANPTGPSFLYAADSLLNEGCRSNLMQIVYTVHFVDVPQITVPVASCEDNINGKLTASGNGGTIKWIYNSQIFTGNELSLKNAGINKGQSTPYVFKTIQTINGCNSDTVLSNVTVSKLPLKPTVPALFKECFNKSFADITAQASGTVTWYSDALKTNKVSSNAILPATIMDKTTGPHTYYAVNYDGACYSDTTTYTYIIKTIPAAPKGKNKYVCELSTVLPTLSVVPQSGAIGVWYTDEALTQGKTESNTYTPSKAEVYVYAVASLDGCEGPAIKLKDTVFKVTPPTISATQTNLCNGEQTVLTAKGTDIKWYDDSKTFLQQQASYTYTGKAAGTFTFYATTRATAPDLTSCYSNYSQGKTIQVYPVPQTPVVTNIQACFNDPVTPLTISYNGSGEVIWQDPQGVNHFENIYTPSRNLLKGGAENDFTVQIKENGCLGNPAILKYNVAPKIKTPEIIQSPMKYCINSDQTLHLFVSSTNLNYWIDENKTIVTIDTVLNRAQKAGVYTYQTFNADKGCYSDTITYVLPVYETPTPTIIGNDSVCENSLRVLYTVDNGSLNDNYDWKVTGNAQLYNIDSKHPNARFIDWNASGVQSVIVKQTTAEGCVGHDTLTVKIAAAPNTNFEYDSPGLEGYINFINTSEQEPIKNGNTKENIGFTSLWNFGNEEADKKINIDSLGTHDKPIVKYYNYGYYTVTLKNKNEFGCESSIEKNIFVNISTGFYVPNSFVPESESPKLRVFKPVGFNLETYQIWIYDTWGNLLWYSNKLVDGSPVEAWDGTYDGQPLKQDSYIWKIEATFKDGKSWRGKKFGNVLLIR